MSLRRNAPDKVKLKLRGDGTPLGDLGNDLLPQEQVRVGSPAAEIRNEKGRTLLDWSGGNGAAGFGHPDPAVAEQAILAAGERLAVADPAAHARLVALGDRLSTGLGELSGSTPDGISLQVRSAPGLLFFALGPDPAAGSGRDAHARFRQAMLKRGIWLPLSPDAPWLITLAHDDAAVDRTVLAATDALGELG